MSFPRTISILLLGTATACLAQVACEDDHPFKTPAGPLTISVCTDAKKGPVKYSIRVGDTKVLEDKYLSREDRDPTRQMWIFRAPSLQETGCPDRLYLLDLAASPPRVSAFGVKGACNEFHWASWGKRSVIAIKNNVRFIYENGKFSLPARGEQLWRSVAPPEAGNGLAEENAVPFAEDVPLPK
jgi:hypothetical protein